MRFTADDIPVLVIDNHYDGMLCAKDYLSTGSIDVASTFWGQQIFFNAFNLH